jgi:hypothetical protein
VAGRFVGTVNTWHGADEGKAVFGDRPEARLPHALMGAAASGARGTTDSVLGPSLPTILLCVWLIRSLCHYATAAAFTTAQAFHVGSDWRVRVEAEPNKSGTRQTSFMPTM